MNKLTTAFFILLFSVILFTMEVGAITNATSADYLIMPKFIFVFLGDVLVLFIEEDALMESIHILYMFSGALFLLCTYCIYHFYSVRIARYKFIKSFVLTLILMNVILLLVFYITEAIAHKFYSPTELRHWSVLEHIKINKEKVK